MPTMRNPDSHARVTTALLDDTRRTTRYNTGSALRGWSYLRSIPVIVYSWYERGQIRKGQWYSIGCKSCDTNIKGDMAWFTGPVSLHRHLMTHVEGTVSKRDNEGVTKFESFEDALTRCGHMEPLSPEIVEFLQCHPDCFPMIRRLKWYHTGTDVQVAPKQWMDVQSIVQNTREWKAWQQTGGRNKE